jgi:hypothetical protein
MLQWFDSTPQVFFLLFGSLFPPFQSCYSLSGIFVGTAKVEIFFILPSFFFNYFKGLYSFSNLPNLAPLYSLRPAQNSLLFIPLTFSFPPKRDAKVRKILLRSNNSAHSFVCPG